jgi:flap endonuclease-1
VWPLGVDLSDLVSRKKTSLDVLSGKSIAVDAYNAMYQFLAIIRGLSGEPLMDRQGRVTSHLSGLLYRTTNLAERGIRLVYVFDGEPPALKEAELKRRMKVKDEAVAKYEEARRRGALDEARKYAQMTSRLKDLMVDDAKRLLGLMGVPWVQAPSEGEAQAAHLAAIGDVWIAASQDYDSLLFGTPRLVRNLAITGKRKLPGKEAYVEVEPEIVELQQVLSELNLTREQLVDLGILIGTDFNPKGLKGVGPKTALRLIKEHGSLEKLVHAHKEGEFPEDLTAIREIFLHPRVSDDCRIDWKKPDIEGVVRFLCGERDFSETRVRNALKKMMAELKSEKGKKTLESFFGQN